MVNYTSITQEYLTGKNRDGTLYLIPIIFHTDNMVNLTGLEKQLNNYLKEYDLKIINQNGLKTCFSEYLIISPLKEERIRIPLDYNFKNILTFLLNTGRREFNFMNYKRRLNLELENGKLTLSRTGENENLIRIKNNILQLTDKELEELDLMINDLLGK